MANLLGGLIEAAYREEQIKAEFSPLKDFKVRKVFQAMLTPGNNILTVKDFKAFFTDD